MNRIISLLPSSTEIICAIGGGERLVGRSHECDYPPTVANLPICTAPKFDPDGTSYQIDQRVKAILQKATSVYRVDADQLDELAPDLLVTQSQCDVCAVSLKRRPGSSLPIGAFSADHSITGTQRLNRCLARH